MLQKEYRQNVYSWQAQLPVHQAAWKKVLVGLGKQLAGRLHRQPHMLYTGSTHCHPPTQNVPPVKGQAHAKCHHSILHLFLLPHTTALYRHCRYMQCLFPFLLPAVSKPCPRETLHKWWCAREVRLVGMQVGRKREYHLHHHMSRLSIVCLLQAKAGAGERSCCMLKKVKVCACPAALLLLPCV